MLRREPGPDGETHEVWLLARKARVTPSAAKELELKASTPRTELHGMLYLTRLITATIEGFPYKVRNIFLATDSECTIAAIETQDRVLQTWFANRVAKVVDHMKSWERKEVEVKKIKKIKQCHRSCNQRQSKSG